MPNIVVTCTFEPPMISILGAPLRQETLSTLERTLPQCTTTTQNAMAIASGQAPKFTLDDSRINKWSMGMPQHYCNKHDSANMNKAIIAALQEEGWTLRTVNAITKPDTMKTLERMFFSRSG